MDKLVGKRGFTSRAEIAKVAIREYLDRHPITENEKKDFERINADSTGIKIFDRTLTGNRLVHVTFTPKGVHCDYHKTDNCEHVKFALEQVDVQELLKEKKKDGWNIPPPPPTHNY